MFGRFGQEQGGFGPAEGSAEYGPMEHQAESGVSYVPGTTTPITIKTEPIEIEGKIPQEDTSGQAYSYNTSEEEGPPYPGPSPVQAGMGSMSTLVLLGLGGLVIYALYGKKGKGGGRRTSRRSRRSSRRRRR